LVNTTEVVPALISGTMRLICVGLMYAKYAGLPLKRTVTPSSDVGNCPPASASFQLAVVEARFVPLIVASELATTPGVKLAPFMTPFGVITGLGGAVATMLRVTGIFTAGRSGAAGVKVMTPW
jgi:hypothetical protein